MKFIQITTGPWHNSDKKLNHTLYALSEDGQIYKYESREWKMLNPLKEKSSDTIHKR